MEIINAFNHTIYRFSTSYTYADLLSSLVQLFNSPKLKFGVKPKERIGSVISTVGTINSEDIMKLPQMKELREFIEQCIYSANPEYRNKKVNVKSVWANQNSKNSATKIHRHGNSLQGVCIFYISVPDSASGNLVIVNVGESSSDNKMISDYSEKDKLYIPVYTGDVIVHSEKVYHGTTQYTGDLPRIAIVFDYKIE